MSQQAGKGGHLLVRPLLPTEQSLSWLAETPRSIAALTADLTPLNSRTRPNPDEWSANDVLAHLRSCADTWGNTILRMIEEDEPTIRAIAPDRWITQTNYRELDFGRHSPPSLPSALISWQRSNRCRPKVGYAQEH